MKMTFQPYFFLSLLLFFLLFFSGCANNPTQPFNDKGEIQKTPIEEITKEQTKNIGILWEVSKIGVASNYVFGTVHSEDERVTRLPPPVSEAFNEANHLALEILLDEATTRTVIKALYFNDGRRLKNLLDNELYLSAIKAMEQRDFSESITNKMKPWAVFTVLNMPTQKTGLFLDAVLYQMAKKQNKTILGLATAQEQTAVFDGMSMSSQIALLRSTLDNQADMDELLNEVIEVYLRRDMNEILAVNSKYENFIDEQLAAEFNQRLIVDRNYRMVERMLPLLEKGNSFVAIGALHLPGDEGILRLLAQHGYNVQAKY